MSAASFEESAAERKTARVRCVRWTGTGERAKLPTMPRAVFADVDENSSVWAATSNPGPPLAPLRGDLQADLVVIGAGFTGLSTAYHLSERFPEKKVVVLEAKRVGNGASGRNAGMVLHWINGPELESPERARRLYSLTSETMDWIQGLAVAHGFPLRFRRDGCAEALTDMRRAEAAHKEAETLASFGLPIRFLSGAALDARLRATGVVGAIFDPTAGRIHGLDLLHGLRGVLLARGVSVLEDSPVIAIEEGASHRLSTPEGSVQAPAMVLATNAHTPSLGYFRGGILPLHSHCVATEPLDAERWRELGWGELAGFSDDLDRIAYASMTAEGRLVFGGGGNAAYSYYYGSRTTPVGSTEPAHRFVRSILDKYFPGARDVRLDHQWTGTLGVTMSRMCSMGVTGAHRNVYYAVGYSGHGITLANLAGRVLCDLYSDHPEPWRDLPFYQAPLRGIPPEPLRWMGYHAFTALTGKSPRR